MVKCIGILLINKSSKTMGIKRNTKDILETNINIIPIVYQPMDLVFLDVLFAICKKLQRLFSLWYWYFANESVLFSLVTIKLTWKYYLFEKYLFSNNNLLFLIKSMCIEKWYRRINQFQNEEEEKRIFNLLYFCSWLTIYVFS